MGRDGFERCAFGMHMMHALVAGFSHRWEHRKGQMGGLHEAPTVPVPVSGVGAALSSVQQFKLFPSISSGLHLKLLVADGCGTLSKEV